MLSSKESTLCQKVVSDAQTTQQTQLLMKKYYLHFKGICRIQLQEDGQIADFFKCSLIVAEKSNFNYTVQGKITSGFIFSFNQILKRIKYKQIIVFLKRLIYFVNVIQVKNQIIKEQIALLINQTHTNLTNSFQFKERLQLFLQSTRLNTVQQLQFNDQLVKFAWILYLDAKKSIYLQNQQISKTHSKCLMATVNYHIIKNITNTQQFLQINTNSFQNRVQNNKENIMASNNRPNIMVSNNRSNNMASDNRSIIQRILKNIFCQFQMKTAEIQVFKSVSQMFDHYFDQLILKGYINFSQTEQYIDFLDSSLITFNYKSMQRKYLKTLKITQIDERIFVSILQNQNSYQKYSDDFQQQHLRYVNLKAKNKRINKSKLGEITEQNKKYNQGIQSSKQYKSHKILNLENPLNQLQTNISVEQTASQFINIPENIIIQKNGLYGFIKQNQIDRYILNLTRPFVRKSSQYNSSILKIIQKCVSMVLKTKDHSQQTIDVNQTKFLIYELFCAFKYMLLDNANQIQSKFILNQTQTMYKSILVSALDIAFYKFGFYKTQLKMLLEFIKPIQTQVFYVYIYLQQLIMPQIIKNNLKLRIEELINQYIWREQGFIEDISNNIQQSESQSQFLSNRKQTFPTQCNENQQLYCILQSLAQQIRIIIFRLRPSLQLIYCATTVQQILKFTRQIVAKSISFYPQIMFNRHLLQIIICANYFSVKVCNKETTFTQLISIYQQVFFNQHTGQLDQFSKLRSLFYQFTVQNETINIIDFYNNQFLPKAKNVFQIQNFSNHIINILCQKQLQSIELQNYHQNILLSPQIFQYQQHLLKKRNNYQTNEQQSQNQFKYQKDPINNQIKLKDIQNINRININLSQKEGYFAFSEVKDIYSNKSPSKVLLSKDLQQNGKISLIGVDFSLNRDPTRVRTRNLQFDETLCFTKKAKRHPIFYQMRKQ